MRMIATIAFCHKDRQATMELVALLADLETKQNLDLDLILVKDYKTEAIPVDFLKKYSGKFRTLQQVLCTTETGGYWPGANALYHFTLNYVHSLVKKNPAFDRVKAWLNLEADCVPLRRDWHKALSESYAKTLAQGKCILGHIIPPTEPWPIHVNGVAIYPTDMPTRFNKQMLGCSPQIPFDVNYAPLFVPKAADDGSFYIKWKVLTIGKTELFTAPEGRPLPTWFHGVKDDSARKAVREKLIEGNDKETTVEVIDRNPGTVFTYFEEIPQRKSSEEKEQLEVWKRTWQAKGFKTVVLNESVARKHPKYAEVKQKIEQLPTVNDKRYEAACYLRWLALGVVGGGLMTDYDVVNVNFTWEKVRSDSDLINIFSENAACPAVCFMTTEGVEAYVDFLLKAGEANFVTEKESPHCSDQELIRQLINDEEQGEIHVEMDDVSGQVGRPLVHFSSSGTARKYNEFTSKSTVMKAFEIKIKQKLNS